MTTALYFHEICARHEMGEGHPEQPARVQVVRDALLTALPGLTVVTPPPATPRELERAHDPRHIERLFSAEPADGYVALDPDTSMNRFSLDSARAAAGAVVAAIDRIAGGNIDNAFCCVRPPGHHAEYDHAMGFCLFNSIAIGAQHALAEHGMERVAVLDFDVHHGNGSEEIFRRAPGVLFCSSYQYPCYPNWNTPSIDGRLVNVPLPAATGSSAFRQAIEASWLPAVRAFSPDLILVSAGFDAHELDPLAGLCLQDEDYGWLGERLMALADECCDGRLVAVLEGGYHLDALARSATAFVRELAADGGTAASG